MTTTGTARPAHTYSPQEFEHEARRIEALTFETLALAPGESVVFCGYTGNGDYVRRALELGCKVAVIEARETIIRDFADLGVRTIRGSTSVIPARDAAFDVAVAAGYLHEVDPSFHTQIIMELGRVAGRIAIVELAPPTDPLGRRIAALYSRAKREFGSFEHYQPLEYWKKLVAMVKAEIAQSVFQFAKLPPIEYLIDTVDLLLDTIEAEEAPEEDIDELRRIAKRSNAMLLPQARLVLVGAAVGAIPKPKYSDAATAHMEVTTVRSTPPPAAAAAAAAQTAPSPLMEPASVISAVAAAIEAAQAMPIAPATAGPAAPSVAPAAAAAAPPAPAQSPLGVPQMPPPSPDISVNPFGLPDTQAPAAVRGPAFAPVPAAAAAADHPPFGAPFPVPPAPDSAPFTPSTSAAVPGWTWEPPEDDLLGG